MWLCGVVTVRRGGGCGEPGWRPCVRACCRCPCVAVWVPPGTLDAAHCASPRVRPQWSRLCACVDDPFRGFRLHRNHEEVSIRGDFKRTADRNRVAANKLVNWVRNIQRRRMRWARNARVATYKRSAVHEIQRVVRGAIAR